MAVVLSFLLAVMLILAGCQASAPPYGYQTGCTPETRTTFVEAPQYVTTTLFQTQYQTKYLTHYETVYKTQYHTHTKTAIKTNNVYHTTTVPKYLTNTVNVHEYITKTEASYHTKIVKEPYYVTKPCPVKTPTPRPTSYGGGGGGGVVATVPGYGRR